MPNDITVTDQAAYDTLQERLVPLWSSIEHLNSDEQTIVVVPSVNVDFEVTPSQLQAYEERYLFLLFLLRQPRARLVYVTGQVINPTIVDYYLDLLPGVIQSNARKRLFLVSPMEASSRNLSRKLLDRPRMLERIGALIPDRNRAHLVPFMSTWEDRELAMRLDIPMYGADPSHAHFGTKTASRQLFSEAGVRHPAGSEDLHTRSDVASALGQLAADGRQFVVKHNEGVSGYGNAIIDLSGLGESPAPSQIEELLSSLSVDEHAGGVDRYFELLESEGGIVEQFIEGDVVLSPSVQLRITPLGDVELLSTHDQILGGDSGQVFIGSQFPARAAYARTISASARRIGEKLAAHGVIGRFAIDYMVVEQPDGSWDEYAIEVNLRKGGTTHPFLTLQFLTDGTYDEAEAVFRAPDGKEKFYVASDHLEIDGLETLTPHDLLDLALMNDLHFDQARQVGSVFHMLSAMPTHGFVGVTSVGDTADEAAERFDKVESVLRTAVESS